MRQSHTKPNSNSGKSNVVSGSGGKVTSVTQKSVGTKRIQSEAIKCGKKRKAKEKAGKGSVQAKHPKESDTEKTQKKHNPGVVKKSCVKVKRLKKPNEKFKKVEGKTDKKGARSPPKVVKKCKAGENAQESEGPPTLCETFSRITTMVAETVINEKENQKLTESLMGKAKKESEVGSSSKHKGEGDAAKSKKGASDGSSLKGKKEGSGKKGELSKKMKAVSHKGKFAVKSDGKKSKALTKKLLEKATLDNTEGLVKVLKDEEIPLVFGKGIGTRRKSTAGSVEGEAKAESTESKSKSGSTSKGSSKDVAVKKGQKPAKKLAKKERVLVKKEKKSRGSESPKKATEEGKRTAEREKEEPSNAKEKKVKGKKEAGKGKAVVKKEEVKSKKRLAVKEIKSPKSKVGSETDGSNSDELTLNIIQKKTKKMKMDTGEKSESSGKVIKFDSSAEEGKTKAEEDSERASSKSKKVKTEKEDRSELAFEKKIFEILKEKKKSKETESDTEEEMELRRILAKKFGRNVKNLPEIKKKKTDSGKSGSESEQRAKRLRLFGFWSGPKRHRVASLNALAKVHCLYENESKGVLAEIEKMGAKADEKDVEEKLEKAGKSDRKVGKKSGKDSENEKLESVVINKRTLRGAPGTRGAGKHWDMFAGDSTTSSASSDESHSDTDRPRERRLPLQPSYRQKMQKKEEGEKEDSSKLPKRRRNTEIGVTMDLKDMVVRKRMASLNASAILAASYSSEKRSNRKDSSGTSTEDGMSSLDDNDVEESPEGGKSSRKKSNEGEKFSEEKNKEGSTGSSEISEYRHKKHFWKTKVESLKKSSKEKRNSPSPILADFGVEKDLSTTVLEKEKNDELNDDKEKDKKGSKFGVPPKKDLEGKLKKAKAAVKEKELAAPMEDPKFRKKYPKRKLGDEDLKNINIEKTDEYEYKSDSDNGQRKLIELRNTGGSNKKVAVIVNQDTDVTITGVYVNSTRSTHHEGFCSIAGMQYRISSTSHTQTEATAVLKTSTASEQTPPPTEPTNCTSPRNHKSYTPLSALSNMQPPAGAPPHPHLPPPPHHHHHLCGMSQHRPPPDHYMNHGPISHQRPISPLGRRHGCTSAFSAPHCSSHPPQGGPSSPAHEGDAFSASLPTHAVLIPEGSRSNEFVGRYVRPATGKREKWTSPEHVAIQSESMKCCKLCDKLTDHQMGKLNGSPRPLFNPLFSPGLPDSVAAVGSLFSYAPGLRDMMMAACLLRGYFQPAGPLIHHHSSNPTPGKGQNLTPLDSASATESHPPTSSADEPGDSTARTGDNPPPPPPPSAHHMGYPRGYPPYQGGYYQGNYYPPPPQSAHYQPPPPPPSFHQHYHHHQDLCYPPGYPPSSYPPPPGSYRRFLQPPPSYYSPELTYGSSGPPPPQDHGGQQMVVPGGPSSSYSAPLDHYPPPAPYYPGYSPGPSPACYSHPPSSRNLAFIEQTYQSCPCPMQLCPKNVHIGPLTGECKRPGALPLPPVALQLPQEPPGAAGPPSPARGSAGMPPQPSPLSNSARPNNFAPAWGDVGKPGKTTTAAEMKWEESRTSLEVKPLAYKTEVVKFADVKEIWDLSRRKKSPFTSLEKEDVKGKETEKFVQGLLVISSKEMTQLCERRQQREWEREGEGEREREGEGEGEGEIGEVLEEGGGKKIKSETVTPPVETGKRGASGEESGSTPKRRKSEESREETEGSKKRKRRSETGNENAENEVKRAKRCVSGKEKDEEKECLGEGVRKRGWKAKLLKDRNETVSREVGGGRRRESEEEVLKREAEKIIGRRKSNQERSGVFPEMQRLRKSRSCSPSRSKGREQSPPRLLREEGKRKGEVGVKGLGRGRTEVKAKGHEHSKKGGKKSGGGGKGGGKGMSILSRYSNGHSASGGRKKGKSESSTGSQKKAKRGLSGSLRTGIAPKWSNGWSWDSESFDAKVYLTNDEPPVMRKCYTAMRHVEGDVIHPKDCILLKAGPRKIDLPFVAKVAALWENPDDGEMMVSLLWYYRPEHTDQGRQLSDQQDEIFASRHKDINSVACIEDKCFVLTYNEYCRYRKKVRRLEEGVAEKNLPVPRLEQPYFRVQRQPPCVMAPDMVFFCRRVYDFRQKRLLKNPT